MCGIIGITSRKHVAEDILDGLKRLEYRGYDSAGIALYDGQAMKRQRAEGKLHNLYDIWYKNPINGTVGIGHTRWATHGIANEQNAHPHMNDHVAVVHNGIIENYRELAGLLPSTDDYIFYSDTDSEVLVLLASYYLSQGLSHDDIMKKLMTQLEGAFAFVLMFHTEPGVLYGARVGSPLAIGVSDDSIIFGSDALSMAHLTNKILYLDDHDWAVIDSSNYIIYDGDNVVKNTPISIVPTSNMLIDKENYQHFMLKEIHEQPTVISDTLQNFIQRTPLEVNLPDMAIDVANIKHIMLSACGTAYYAGLVSCYWFEELAHINAHIDIASEFRYRNVICPDNSLGIIISQSGETMDTLEAMKIMAAMSQPIISISNVESSTIARKSTANLLTKAGVEIGVASTKAFTTQLITLYLLALNIGRANGTLTAANEAHLLHDIIHIPALINQTLLDQDYAKNIAAFLEGQRNILYLGRGTSYPLALEGALKLKEVSYIHAEGYAAGEMKHGPIALIEKGLPIIALIPDDKHFTKTLSNLQEAAARGAHIIPITSQEGLQKIRQFIHIKHYYIIPAGSDIQHTITLSVALQLIAYYTAALKGTDVDQPRNLAKSVTVE